MKTLPLLTALLLSLGLCAAGAQTEPTRSRAEVKSEARAATQRAQPSRGESAASELPPQVRSNKTRGEVKDARAAEARAAAARGEPAVGGESSTASNLPPATKSKKPRSEVKEETRTALKAAPKQAADSAPGR